MFKKLQSVETHFNKIERSLQSPNVLDDKKKYQALMKEFSDMQPVVECYRAHKKATADKESALGMLSGEVDPELKEMAKEEIKDLDVIIDGLVEKLKVLLLPKDPRDDKNVFLELRSGAGGDEACLFADELFRAYEIFASSQKWKFQEITRVHGTAGGIKEAAALIQGDKIFSFMKHERGVHRVQRVPKTESQGRVHTSTITVAVIPEAEVSEVHVDPKDVKVDVYRSSGAGGQHVNTTDSAVRLTHLPSGLVVTCQDEKSQTKNKAKAFKVLASRLIDIEEEKKIQAASEQRLAQIGTGDRSERIRTYNFPQSRVTDHRINLTLQKVNEVMSGDLLLVIEPLQAAFQAEALKASTSS